MIVRLRDVLARLRANSTLRRRMPLILLGLLSFASIGARTWYLDVPREDQPGKGFVFDEKYYVNASRVIAGVPMQPADTYANASPSGTDPNAEHPQLGKLLIAASIRLIGDNPVGWRITAVLFGTAALLLLYWLVRCLHGPPWLALATTAIAAADNLWLVHGRIAVLDIYCVPFMLAGVCCYLKRRPLVAGVIIGIGACIKEFALYAVLAILLLEAIRGVEHLVKQRRVRWRSLAAPAMATGATLVTFVGLLAVLDTAVTPYHDGKPVDTQQAALCDHLAFLSKPCNHIAFMNDYAANLRSPDGPKGIASYPWQFWGNVEPIDYYTIRTTVTVDKQVTAVNEVVAFRGEIQPVILVTAWIGIVVAAVAAIRRRDRLSTFALVWIAATWLPAELSSLFAQRTTYLYYMVVTMPAVYIVVARLLSYRRIPRWVVGVWVGLLIAGFVVVYPFRSWTGG